MQSTAQMNSQALIEKSTQWLIKDVFPLWIKKGIDPKNGSFIESLTSDYQPTDSPRRAMVQARQIYSFTEAVKMNILKSSAAEDIISNSTQCLMTAYSLPSGAFLHAIDSHGKPESLQSELYTQAFVLFGLARSFELLQKNEIKQRALKLVHYLKTERRGPHGGFTEIKNNEIQYQSNPHMHLFEAVIEWARIDSDPAWKELGVEIFQLCKNKFIDPETGFLAEYFSADWKPLRENNVFVFEPGHQYEWAWLFQQFEKNCATATGDMSVKLFSQAEKCGVHKGFAVDELWSNHQIKKASSRFWPQSERVKAALEVGLMKSQTISPQMCAHAADEALKALWIFMDTSPAGLWQDTRLESGEFTTQAAKASSLYHIINAMSEYVLKRSRLPT